MFPRPLGGLFFNYRLKMDEEQSTLLYRSVGHDIVPIEIEPF